MSFRKRRSIPDLGIGVGARPAHDEDIRRTFAESESVEDKPIDWLEIISENFFAQGGATKTRLDMLRASCPLIPHGVSLSIGGTDPFRADYIQSLRRVVDTTNPPWFSDHLCFTGVGLRESHDLLPLPYTKEAVLHVASRIREVQDRVERLFALENVSSYLTYEESEMPEWEFLSEIAERADCGILLDINNIYVSGKNHGFDPDEYVANVPLDRVVQVHLAGHTDKGDHLLDTHSSLVTGDVWSLYESFVERAGSVATLLEWDDALPTYESLLEEASRARAVRDRALSRRAPKEPGIA